MGGLGILARKRGQLKEAIAAFTKVLDVYAGDNLALSMRAATNWDAGNRDAAFDDATAALKTSPYSPELYLIRMNFFRSRGQSADVRATAESMITIFPNNAYAQVIVGMTFASLHDTTEAMKAFDRALAIKPEAYIYVNRLAVRPKADIAGRSADLDAALKLDPNMPEALATKAEMQAASGDLTGALANFFLALKKSPDDSTLLNRRGIVYAKSGDADNAESDFAIARAKAAGQSNLLNNLCWTKAAGGVALESALVDCDAALKISPDEGAILDSRGLVLLRLNRFDEAIAYYDKALVQRPTLSASLFGRAVAWARKGNSVQSDADAAAAIKIDPNISEAFAEFGVTR